MGFEAELNSRSNVYLPTRTLKAGSQIGSIGFSKLGVVGGFEVCGQLTPSSDFWWMQISHNRRPLRDKRGLGDSYDDINDQMNTTDNGTRTPD